MRTPINMAALESVDGPFHAVIHPRRILSDRTFEEGMRVFVGFMLLAGIAAGGSGIGVPTMAIGSLGILVAGASIVWRRDRSIAESGAAASHSPILSR